MASSNSFYSILLACIVLLSLNGLVHGMCYFPAAYQGEYVTQAIMSGIPTISYSSLSILSDSIPVWGMCHRRVGNNVVLVDDTGGLTCYKCFNLVLRSSNVLQIHTAALDKCYTTEEKALADCPSDMSIREKRSREIMLYRTKGFMGEPAVSPTYCPINGAYTFTYSVNDGTENSLECQQHTSEISDCPYGFGLNLKFKGCSFGNMDMSFHCLGDWEGPSPNQRYVALMDTHERAGDVSTRPIYRCALYEEDDATGEIKFALSSDSTCSNHLKSSTEGYETLKLAPMPQKPWPSHVRNGNQRHPRANGGSVSFPSWAQGKWEHIHVQGSTMLLKDHRNFKTYTAKMVANSAHPERFLVYARTQCGDEHYKCVWLKNRGDNALEFQLGLYTSPTHNDSLCLSENFQERTWTTQGRVEVSNPTPYPIIGEYTGVIPDTDSFCAKLYSDCNNPEIMFYSIFNCFNRSEIFEEREYRCLGQWTENGQIYTYTERRDMIGYECFVGVLTAKGDIYLLEAGQNCERGHEPMKRGMRLTQVSKCYGHPKWRSKNRSTTKPASRPRITALPTWRERQLEGTSGSTRPVTSNVTSLVLAAVTICVTFVTQTCR